MKEEKSENSQKVLVGVGAAAVVVVVGLMMYFLRASDPAASGPIPYKKFDYGAHMEQQNRQFNRDPTTAATAPPSGPAPSGSFQSVRPTNP